MYVGMALDAIKRLNEHNHGKNRYTKGHIPWEIIYSEEQPDWKTARIREKYLKSAAGKKWLKNIWTLKEELWVPCLRDAVRRESRTCYKSLSIFERFFYYGNSLCFAKFKGSSHVCGNGIRCNKKIKRT